MTWKSGLLPVHDRLQFAESSGTHATFHASTLESNAVFKTQSYPGDYRRIVGQTLTLSGTQDNAFQVPLVVGGVSLYFTGFFSHSPATMRLITYGANQRTLVDTSFLTIDSSNIYGGANPSHTYTFSLPSNEQSTTPQVATTDGTYIYVAGVLHTSGSPDSGAVMRYSATASVPVPLIFPLPFTLGVLTWNGTYIIGAPIDVPGSSSFLEDIAYAFNPSTFAITHTLHGDGLGTTSGTGSRPQCIYAESNKIYIAAWDHSATGFHNQISVFTNYFYEQTIDLGAGTSGTLVQEMFRGTAGLWCRLSDGRVFLTDTSTNSTVSAPSITYANTEAFSFSTTTNGASSFTLSGTPVAGDVLTLVATDNSLLGGLACAVYTVRSGDTLSSVATGMTAIIPSALAEAAIQARVRPTVNTITVESWSPNGTGLRWVSSNPGTTVAPAARPNKGTEIVKLGGTGTFGETITLEITDSGLSGGAHSVEYTVTHGDQGFPSRIAFGLANLVNNDSQYKAIGLYASLYDATISLVSDSFNTTTYAVAPIVESFQVIFAPDGQPGANPNNSTAGPPVMQMKYSGTLTTGDRLTLNPFGIAYVVSVTDTVGTMLQNFAARINSLLFSSGYVAAPYGYLGGASKGIALWTTDTVNPNYAYAQSGTGTEAVTVNNTNNGNGTCVEATLNFGGILTAGDVLTIEFNHGTIEDVTYQVALSDDFVSLAANVANAINTANVNGGIIAFTNGNKTVIDTSVHTKGTSATTPASITCMSAGINDKVYLGYSGGVYKCGDLSTSLPVTSVVNKAFSTFSVPIPTAISALYNSSLGVEEIFGIGLSTVSWLANGFSDASESAIQTIQDSGSRNQGYQYTLSTFLTSVGLDFGTDALTFSDLASTASSFQYARYADLPQKPLFSDSLTASISLYFNDYLIPQDTLTKTKVLSVPLAAPPWQQPSPDVWRAGLLPVHAFLRAPTTTGQHTVWKAQLQNERAAYINMKLDGPFFDSGFQYLGPAMCSVTFNENLPSYDLLGTHALLRDQELLPVFEGFVTDPFPATETSPLKEVWYQSVTKRFEDHLLLHETASSVLRETAIVEKPVFSDSMSRKVTLHFQDLLRSSEVSTALNPAAVNDFYSVRILVTGRVSEFFTVKPEISVNQSGDSYNVMIPVMQNTLVAVTNATSASNPFAPTLAVRGTVLYQGIGNPAPTNLSNTSVYLNFLSAGITNLNSCGLFNFGFSLDYNGGSFSITSQAPIAGSYYTLIPIGSYNPIIPQSGPIIVYTGSYPTSNVVYPNILPPTYAGASYPTNWVPNNLGEALTFFGLKGAIVDSGRVLSNSAKGYVASGQFGNPMLNRQMSLLAYNNPAFNAIFSAPPTVNFPQPQNQMTCNQAAQAIFSTINSLPGNSLRLMWAVQDAPYYDAISQAGSTGLEAVASLAQRCGGVLRWDGNNNYIVAYPDIGYGTWSVPNCALLGAAGMQEEYILDLGTGRTGTGLVNIPALPQTNNSQNVLPAAKNKGNSPTVGQFGPKITQKPKATDPPKVYDLPQNFDQVYIQILVGAGADLSGSGPLTASGWVTNDPTVWYPFNVDGQGADIQSGNPAYIFQTNIGGRYIPQCKVDFNVFPSANANVDRNEFVLSMACSVKDLSGQFAAAQADQTALQRMHQEYNVQNYRFVKTYSGTINCMFFGSIPLPGMIASATSGDLTVSGIIESVQFQYPGFITVQVARYLRLDLLKPPLTWSAAGGTGISVGYPIGT